MTIKFCVSGDVIPAARPRFSGRRCYQSKRNVDGERIQRANSVKDALKAAETLAKISGLFVNRAEVDLSVANVPIVIRDDI